MRNFMAASIAGIVLSLVCIVNAAPTFFNIPLDGSQVVPEPGDLDATGTALFTINPATTTIEWLITVNDVDAPLTGAQIHQAPAGSEGSAVLDFDEDLGDTGFIDAGLATAIVDNPLDYYVNVNSELFPDGVVRGQFTVGETCPVCPPAIPAPAAISLVMMGLASLRLFRRGSL
jgi:hypothetical protein